MFLPHIQRVRSVVVRHPRVPSRHQMAIALGGRCLIATIVLCVLAASVDAAPPRISTIKVAKPLLAKMPKSALRMKAARNVNLNRLRNNRVMVKALKMYSGKSNTELPASAILSQRSLQRNLSDLSRNVPQVEPILKGSNGGLGGAPFPRTRPLAEQRFLHMQPVANPEFVAQSMQSQLRQSDATLPPSKTSSNAMGSGEQSAAPRYGNIHAAQVLPAEQPGQDPPNGPDHHPFHPQAQINQPLTPAILKSTVGQGSAGNSSSTGAAAARGGLINRNGVLLQAGLLPRDLFVDQVDAIAATADQLTGRFRPDIAAGSQGVNPSLSPRPAESIAELQQRENSRSDNRPDFDDFIDTDASDPDFNSPEMNQANARMQALRDALIKAGVSQDELDQQFGENGTDTPDDLPSNSPQAPGPPDWGSFFPGGDNSGRSIDDLVEMRNGRVGAPSERSQLRPGTAVIWVNEQTGEFRTEPWPGDKEITKKVDPTLSGGGGPVTTLTSKYGTVLVYRLDSDGKHFVVIEEWTGKVGEGKYDVEHIEVASNPDSKNAPKRRPGDDGSVGGAGGPPNAEVLRRVAAKQSGLTDPPDHNSSADLDAARLAEAILLRDLRVTNPDPNGEVLPKSGPIGAPQGGNLGGGDPLEPQVGTPNGPGPRPVVGPGGPIPKGTTANQDASYPSSQSGVEPPRDE